MTKATAALQSHLDPISTGLLYRPDGSVGADGPWERLVLVGLGPLGKLLTRLVRVDDRITMKSLPAQALWWCWPTHALSTGPSIARWFLHQRDLVPAFFADAQHWMMMQTWPPTRSTSVDCPCEAGALAQRHPLQLSRSRSNLYKVHVLRKAVVDNSRI